MDVYGLKGHSEKKGYFENNTFDKPFVAIENPHTWQVSGYCRTKTWYRDGYQNKKQAPYWIPDLTEEEILKIAGQRPRILAVQSKFLILLMIMPPFV